MIPYSSANDLRGSAAAAAIVAMFSGMPATVAPEFQELKSMPASQPSAIFRRFDGLEFFTIDFGVQPAGPSLEIVVDQPRATTDAEQAIGELRAWKLLGENWDGEQSLAPNQTSISQAIAFIYALEPRMPLPEPVLHSNGRAGLFWETAELTADLEFYDDGRVTYFVQKSERSKHRGVEIFTGEQLSGIFRALLG